MLKRIMREIIEDVYSEILALFIIISPIVPVMLYVEDEKLKNLFYIILIPFGVLASCLIWIKIKKSRIFKNTKNSDISQLNNTDPHLKNELIIKNKI